MFEDVADAVRAHREAGVAHRRARERGDAAGMAAAGDRLRVVAGYLRAHHRADLIHPLTMEWVTDGRDLAEHARYREQVDTLTNPSSGTGVDG